MWFQYDWMFNLETTQPGHSSVSKHKCIMTIHCTHDMICFDRVYLQLYVHLKSDLTSLTNTRYQGMEELCFQCQIASGC